MSNRKDDEPIELEDVPVEEGISGGDATERRAGDTIDDPAHSADEDEGWISEGGATPSGPASDVGRDH